ncbi:hypothetical protein Tco_0216469 [Tanacetum coccineum]
MLTQRKNGELIHGAEFCKAAKQRCKVGGSHAGPGNRKGMDWLSKYHTVNGCNVKLVRIPLGDETINDSGQ